MPAKDRGPKSGEGDAKSGFGGASPCQSNRPAQLIDVAKRLHWAASNTIQHPGGRVRVERLPLSSQSRFHQLSRLHTRLRSEADVDAAAARRTAGVKDHRLVGGDKGRKGRRTKTRDPCKAQKRESPAVAPSCLLRCVLATPPKAAVIGGDCGQLSAIPVHTQRASNEARART